MLELFLNERKASMNALPTRRKTKPSPQFYDQFWWSRISLLAKAVLWLENSFYQRQVSLIIPARFSALLIHLSECGKFSHLLHMGSWASRGAWSSCVGWWTAHRNGLCSPCKRRRTLRSRAWAQPKRRQRASRRVRRERNHFAQLVVGAAPPRCTCLFGVPQELFPCQGWRFLATRGPRSSVRMPGACGGWAIHQLAAETRSGETKGDLAQSSQGVARPKLVCWCFFVPS